MGDVHPATDAAGNQVAAKRICGKDERSMAKVTKDLHKPVQLDHPNIVKFYDINDLHSQIGIFMEFCSHKDLNQFFPKTKTK